MNKSIRRCSLLAAVFILLARISFADVASGSGFIIQADGFILTNYHVIRGSSVIAVVVPGRQPVKAEVVGTDSYRDLALLKVPMTDLPTLPIGSSQSVEVLDPVTVLGYPLTNLLGADVSASDGKVNALREEGQQPYFQIDANVNPGNSGGPLLNNRGEVVGIVEAKIDAMGVAKNTGSIPERINFAIPIDEARAMIRKAFPFAFTPSNRREVLSGQEVFKRARPGTVLIYCQLAQANLPSSNPGSPQSPEASQSNNEQYFTSSIAGFDQHWLFVMSLGTSFTSEKLIKNHQWPKSDIKTHWSEGYEITNVAGDGGSWVVTMHKGSPFTEQMYFGPAPFPSFETLSAKFLEGYRITSVAGFGNQWVVVFSKGSAYKNQVIAEPGKWDMPWIKQNWDAGYRITTVAGDFSKTGEEFVVIMSQGSGIEEQSVIESDDYPRDRIRNAWDEGYHITAATGSSGWKVVMSKGLAFGLQRYSLSRELPTGWILGLPAKANLD
jgi:hypothetical protein